MCGVFGWIKFKDDFKAGELAFARRALDALRHRGPDAQGEVAEPRLFVGHRRLSILDLSAAANQPFRGDGCQT